MSTTTTTTQPTTSPRPSTATQCDRCGANAVTFVLLPSGLDLVLCGHHTNEHDLNLAVMGATFSPVAV